MKTTNKKSRTVLWLVVISVFIAVHVVLLMKISRPVDSQGIRPPPAIPKSRHLPAPIAPATDRAKADLARDAAEIAERAAIDYEEMTEDISDTFESDWIEKVQ